MWILKFWAKKLEEITLRRNCKVDLKTDQRKNDTGSFLQSDKVSDKVSAPYSKWKTKRGNFEIFFASLCLILSFSKKKFNLRVDFGVNLKQLLASDCKRYSRSYKHSALRSLSHVVYARYISFTDSLRFSFEFQNIISTLKIARSIKIKQNFEKFICVNSKPAMKVIRKYEFYMFL